MSKNMTDSPFIHTLNDLLAKSDKYSEFTNPLFKDLAFPPGLYINNNSKPSKLRYTTTCFECIDDSTYSKLLTLADADTDDKTKTTKKTSKKTSKKNNKKTHHKEEKSKKNKSKKTGN